MKGILPIPNRQLAKSAVFLFVISTLYAHGADWPQYRGMAGNGESDDGIEKQWTQEMAAPIWRVQFTNGISSLTAGGGRVFTQVKRKIGSLNKEVCLALDAQSGQEKWATTVEDANYPGGGVGSDDGPRSTPVMNGDSVFVLTSYIKLLRLNVTNGSVIWQKDLVSLYSGRVIEWQNSASPVIESNLIYVNSGAANNSILALRTGDGSLAWRAEAQSMTHSTPVMTSIHGIRQIIFATQKGLLSLNPQTGARFWLFTYPFSYSTSLAVSPVVHEDKVFISGAHSYGMGSCAAQISVSNSIWTATRLWSTNNPASHWMTPVCLDGYLYGMFGIQSYDSASAQLKCIDIKTGAVKWSQNNFGRGGIALVDRHLVALTEKGDLVLAKPDPNSYIELGRFQAISNYNSDANKCWNAPAVYDGRFYVRSTAQGACYDLSRPRLRLKSLQILPGKALRFNVVSTTGMPLRENRLPWMEVLASSELNPATAEWQSVYFDTLLTNGSFILDYVEDNPAPFRFFQLRDTQ